MSSGALAILNSKLKRELKPVTREALEKVGFGTVEWVYTPRHSNCAVCNEPVQKGRLALSNKWQGMDNKTEQEFICADCADIHVEKVINHSHDGKQSGNSRELIESFG